MGPFASKTTRIVCCPEVSATAFDTVVQFCQPPVFGIVNGPVTLVPSNSTWKMPPWPRQATRASSR